MSGTIYNKAFVVELSHDFYLPENKFQINKNLELFPTEECAQLLSSGRMRAVRTGAGLDVFYKSYLDATVPAEKPLIELSGDQAFIFGMRLNDPMSFVQNVTDLSDGAIKYSSGKIILLDAVAPSSFVPPAPYTVDFNYSLLDQLRPAIFTYSFLPDNAGFTGAVTVTVKAEGAVSPVLTFTGVLPDPATGIYSVSIDLSKEAKGIYEIKAESSGPTTQQHLANIYVDSNLASENIFGLIRVKYAAADIANLYETCSDKTKFFDFSYAFPNREVQWRYYVAIKNIPHPEDPSIFFGANHFTITDTNNTSPITFTPLDSPGVYHPDFFINGQYTVVFTSTSPNGGKIGFKETAIDTLQLKQVKTTMPFTVKPMIDVLPNAATLGVDSNRIDPSDIDNSYAEIFVFLDTVIALI